MPDSSPSSFLEISEEAAKRWEALNAGERPWIRIGTAICGEAAGAFAVADAVETELESQGVSAEVSRVGCLGLCFAEPLLDVQLPGGHRVFYGNVDVDDVSEIVSAHVSGG
ncbi:MAG: (2Fe-2S) ferredoxin domain-containing protein, partial [SAR202 cluster bacterium]|nr:(2Fe-2S) ferredoxin domain-containing protein [SAR202 cluster bacterium]